MSGSPGRDARATLLRAGIIVPVVVVILLGALLFWLLGFRLA